MKTIKKYVLLLLVLISTSCSKDKQTLIDNTWVVESMNTPTDSIWQYDSQEQKQICNLTFESRYKYSISSQNTVCGGKVKIAAKQKIQFKGGDPCPYTGGNLLSWSVLRLLKEITHYELLDDKLILKGDNGEIINLVKQ